MTTPRAQLIDAEVPLHYHLVSRCVRRSFLCGTDPLTGNNYDHRKQWFVNRLRQLARSFAVAIDGYAIMDNHFHLVVYFDPKASSRWSREEVASRWTNAFPPRGNSKELEELKTLQCLAILADDDRLDRCRRTLGSLSDFMKHLKQPIARRANQEDDCRGHFFEGRFYSGALLDEEALLAAMAYVDLNPVRAKIVRSIEAFAYTSIHQRLADVANRPDRLEQAVQPLVSGLLQPVPMPRITLAAYCEHLRHLIIADQHNRKTWHEQVTAFRKRQRAYGDHERLVAWAEQRGWQRLGGISSG